MYKYIYAQTWAKCNRGWEEGKKDMKKKVGREGIGGVKMGVKKEKGRTGYM